MDDEAGRRVRVHDTSPPSRFPEGVRKAFNVREFGLSDGQPMVFAHGFGCEQGMWRYVVPAFAETHRVIVFDHMGLGGSDVDLYDANRYETLDGYAHDVLAICTELQLRDVVYVGHSVSSMIGVLAAGLEPDRFSELVLLCPSPRYLDDPVAGYEGGFSAADIDGLLSTLSVNYMGWAEQFAPVVMGSPIEDPLTEELAETFCRAEPAIAQRFARATFLADNRRDLQHVRTRTLVIQSARDVIAPQIVGRYVADQIPGARLEVIDAVGHCPNMSAPGLTAATIRAFL